MPIMDVPATACERRRVSVGSRPRTRGERGQSLAELAVLLPILLIIALGAVDFGRAYFASQAVDNAARTGAQYAAVSTANAGNLNGIQTAVAQESGGLASTPTVTAATGADSMGKTYTRITVSYNFTTMIAWPGLPHSIPMTRTVQMRVGS